MTSLAEQPKAEALCDRGFSDYLLKPVRASRLLEALLRAVKGRGEFERVVAANNCDLPGGNYQSNAVNSAPTLNILLAEDHPINQQVILEQLAVLGYRADCAANGQEALDLLAARAYDLVLMDCQMPVLDGYATARKLRVIEGNDRHTFIVALTAHAMPGEREKCLAAGMDDYLSKPVDLDALAGVLKKYELGNVQWETNSEVKNINLAKKCLWETNRPEVLETATVSRAVANTVANAAAKGAIEFYNGEDAEGLFDRTRLEQLGQVNIKLPHRLLQAFVENARSDLATASVALEARDWEAVEYRAHRLKGTAANVGIPMMSDLAAQLEHQARRCQDIEELPAIEGIENILTNLLSYLTRVQKFVETQIVG